MLPNDCPPWELVYQQRQRWLQAGCFEHMVSDLRSVIRVAQGQGQPSAVILNAGAYPVGERRNRVNEKSLRIVIACIGIALTIDLFVKPL